MKLIAQFLSCAMGMMMFSSYVSAESLVAVCKDPAGRSIGKHGWMGGFEVADEIDGMTGGVITLNWNGEEFASLVIQGAKGTTPNTETALSILKSKEQYSFLVLYEEAVWLYSVFPLAKTMLITQHMNGFSVDRGGAINKAMSASCTVELSQ